MKPLRVWAKNYATYGDVEWLIPEGVTAILGQNEAGDGISSNGAGKTRLLEILPLALWGPSSWSDYVAAGSDGVCEVGCEFEHSGDVFRVRRTYNPSGRGKATLDLETLEADVPTGRHDETNGREQRADVWLPLTRESIAATQTAIRDLLGIGEATFHHSVFAAQGARHFADAELTPKERGEILADGLGLDRWDAFREVAAADRLALEREQSGLQSQLAAWREQLENTEFVRLTAEATALSVHNLERSLADARETHAALDAKYRTARETLTTRAAAEREVDALLSTVRLLEQQGEAADAAATEIALLEGQLAEARVAAVTVPALAADLERLQAQASERERAIVERDGLVLQGQEQQAVVAQLVTQAEALEASRRHRVERADLLVGNGAGSCDRCGQELKDDALAASVQSLRAEAETLGVAHEEALALIDEHHATIGERASRIGTFTIPEPVAIETLTAARNALTEARTAENTAASIAGRILSLSKAVEAHTGSEHAASLTVAREAHTEATGRLVALSADAPDEAAVALLARDTLGAQVETERIEAELATARTAHGTATERARALTEIAAQHDAAVANAADQQFDLDVLRELEKAYGRSGIPVLLLESLYVPQIEREANLVLSAWGVPYTVELVTQREQKTTDRLKDTLEVVVHSPDGPRRYSTYSGGERDRVSVALRIALARTIASHRGHSLQVFALDELAHLDAAGVEKLAELLTELQREIPIIWFVSHSSDLNDAFDQRVMVVREGGRSRIEVAA